MESVFVQGIAGFIAALAVFVGGIWLLLALVLGARLSYFVTASVTLGFTLLMGLVWSVGDVPLGPVGQLPEWENVGIGETVGDIGFGPASQYPDGEWREFDSEDSTETAKAGELEGAAGKVLKTAIADGTIKAFSNSEQATSDKDSLRLLVSGDDEYGAITFEPRPAGEGDFEFDFSDVDVPEKDAKVFVVMKYDPGNPFGKARMITAGTFVLFVGHLFGLSRSESRARKRKQAEA